MEEKIIYELGSIYRDNMRVRGYTFGKGEKSVCIMGATRGNEVQQIFICAKLIQTFTQLEKQGKIRGNHSILVVPTANSYSMNIGKRFWSTDNTDINRMFPGYHLGETTQRIAAGVFETVKDYTFGIQFASFYMKGSFIPHVRVMKTGYEDMELAKDFGLPYIYRRNPKPYDTTTLNYNWQVWETKAYSVYSNATDSIDEDSAYMAINAVLVFLNKQGIIDYKGHEGYRSQMIEGSDLVDVKSEVSGIVVRKVRVNDRVKKGDTLAEILDPYTGVVLDNVKAPANGIVFFHISQPLTHAQTVLFRLIPTDGIF